MSIKFSISTVAIAAFLTLTYGSIATAEVYKTSKNQVVVTGLTAKQKYPIQAVNAKSKTVKRQDVAANTCGEALIDGAAKYKSLVVGTETIDPATLPTKTHANCKGKKTATTVKKSQSTTGTTGNNGMTGNTAPATTGTTTTPATGTTTPSTVPTAVPSTAPATK
jgi:hypothetical protein